MSEFFQIFQPGLRHQQEQRDLDKILVVEADAGGSGPKPLDLESGSVVLRMPGADPAPTNEPAPDNKDWTWVLQRRCPECNYLGSEIVVAELPELVLAATEPWAQVLARPQARQRPTPQVWSPLEYACHVRDVLELFTHRVELVRTQNNPEFPDWDQDFTAIEARYAAQDPAVVAVELQAAAAANSELWAAISGEEWQRPSRRSNGTVFTLDSLGRYFLHDLRHHLVDVAA